MLFEETKGRAEGKARGGYLRDSIVGAVAYVSNVMSATVFPSIH